MASRKWQEEGETEGAERRARRGGGAMRRCCLPPYVSRPRGCARLSHSEAAALCLGRPATRGFNPPRQCKSRAALTNASDGCARERGRGPRWRSWVRSRKRGAVSDLLPQQATTALCRCLGRLEFVSAFVSEFVSPQRAQRGCYAVLCKTRLPTPRPSWGARPSRQQSGRPCPPPMFGWRCPRGRLVVGASVALSASGAETTGEPR